ncbi:hypothetical protein [uncultured Microscilla sp.]|uniref:hypothetical protein n=1 Tax=uncultured Microscilla sp. TaxID=432653 RepID=UPI002637C8C6|nr:hypothetical protein [uncultured Microscilla sp.]
MDRLDLKNNFPAYLNDWKFQFDQLFKAIEEQYSDSRAFVVSGCQVLGSDISAGLVSIDGKILEFSGATNVLFPAYIKQATPVQHTERFFVNENTNKTTRINYHAELVSVKPVTGEYIVIDNNKTIVTREFLAYKNNHQPGQKAWFDTSYTGAKTLIEMQRLGWCIEDGSTTESQLVDTGYFPPEELAIVGATKNLVGKFVRGGNVPGVEQSPTVISRVINTSDSGGRSAIHTPTNPDSVHDIWAGHWTLAINQDSGGPTTYIDGGFTARPANVSALPLVYALK